MRGRWAPRGGGGGRRWRGGEPRGYLGYRSGGTCRTAAPRPGQRTLPSPGPARPPTRDAPPPLRGREGARRLPGFSGPGRLQGPGSGRRAAAPYSRAPAGPRSSGPPGASPVPASPAAPPSGSSGCFKKGRRCSPLLSRSLLSCCPLRLPAQSVWRDLQRGRAWSRSCACRHPLWRKGTSGPQGCLLPEVLKNN